MNKAFLKIGIHADFKDWSFANGKTPVRHNSSDLLSPSTGVFPK